MNLLLTTLGMSWAIVPELLGFTNPQQLDLYAHHQDVRKNCKPIGNFMKSSRWMRFGS